jgi:hypothetical protein
VGCFEPSAAPPEGDDPGDNGERRLGTGVAMSKLDTTRAGTKALYVRRLSNFTVDCS